MSSLKFVPTGLNDKKIIIGLGIGLVSNRRQAIACANLNIDIYQQSSMSCWIEKELSYYSIVGQTK